MAMIKGNVITDEIALVAATEKTIIQLKAPANQRVKIRGWGIFFDGVSAGAEPVEVELKKQTTDGTMTTHTPVNETPGSAETIQSTAKRNATVEPTSTDMFDALEVHPQTGYEKIYPMGEEPVLAGGERMAITAMAPAVVNCRAKLYFEE